MLENIDRDILNINEKAAQFKQILPDLSEEVDKHAIEAPSDLVSNMFIIREDNEQPLKVNSIRIFKKNNKSFENKVMINQRLFVDENGKLESG